MTDEPNQPPDSAAAPIRTLPESTVGTETDVSASDAKNEASRLTPEEQLALFEKELKENDWGHQPC